MAYPISLTDGKTMLFESFGPGGTEDDKLGVASLGAPGYTVLNFLAVKPLGYLDGYIICLRWDGVQGTIVALPVDLRAKTITGDPIELSGQGCFDSGCRTLGRRHACLHQRGNQCAAGF